MPTPLTATFHPYHLPFRRPFVTASGSHTAREGYLVRLTTPDGGLGYGEAAPLPGHGGGAIEDVLPSLRRLADALVAVVASDGIPRDPDAWRALMRRLGALAPESPAALAGLDLALADLAARRACLPLARWLSPDARRMVEVNATIGAAGLGEVADQARQAVAQGYRTLKLKLRGGDDLDDIVRVAALRQAAGDGIALRLDANGAWDEARALAMLPALRAYDIEYVEQPVPARDAARDIPSLARVRAASPVPVAADEALLLPGGPEAVVAARAADVLILKPALIGGLARVWGLAMALQGLADAPEVVITSALDGAIGRLGALHLAAALPGPMLACGLATGDLLAEDVAATPEVRQGWMAIGAVPGLGVRLEEGWIDNG